MLLNLLCKYKLHKFKEALIDVSKEADQGGGGEDRESEEVVVTLPESRTQS
jgi:hypothetical protein